MSEEGINPFSSDDSNRGGQPPGTSPPDIGELIRIADSGERPQGTSIETAEVASSHIRTVSLSVLQELQDLGVTDAGKLVERLKELDPQNKPMFADLGAVAASYDQDQTEALDDNERSRLHKMSAMAQAAFGISKVQESRSISGEDAPVDGFLIESAERMLESTVGLLPDHEVEALKNVLHNAQMPIPPPLGLDN